MLIHTLYWQYLKQEVSDHKPMLDRLNKTGSALLKLVGGEDSSKLQDLLNADNSQFDAIKNNIREKSNALDDAFQQSSEVSFGIFLSIIQGPHFRVKLGKNVFCKEKSGKFEYCLKISGKNQGI